MIPTVVPIYVKLVAYAVIRFEEAHRARLRVLAAPPFEEMLPNSEVVVPEKDKDLWRDLPAAGKIERAGVCALRAGACRNEAGAGRVRAQLALQGIDAKAADLDALVIRVGG
jgi:hypothetical protein